MSTCWRSHSFLTDPPHLLAHTLPGKAAGSYFNLCCAAGLPAPINTTQAGITELNLCELPDKNPPLSFQRRVDGRRGMSGVRFMFEHKHKLPTESASALDADLRASLFFVCMFLCMCVLSCHSRRAYGLEDLQLHHLRHVRQLRIVTLSWSLASIWRQVGVCVQHKPSDWVCVPEGQADLCTS